MTLERIQKLTEVLVADPPKQTLVTPMKSTPPMSYARSSERCGSEKSHGSSCTSGTQQQLKHPSLPALHDSASDDIIASEQVSANAYFCV